MKTSKWSIESRYVGIHNGFGTMSQRCAKSDFPQLYLLMTSNGLDGSVTKARPAPDGTHIVLYLILRYDNRISFKPRFYIYDCDAFTKQYLEHVLGKEVKPKKTVTLPSPEPIVPIPEQTIVTIGNPEDSLQNCLRLTPKPPKKDFRKFLEFSGKVRLLQPILQSDRLEMHFWMTISISFQTLRFEAKIHSPWLHDAERKFIFTYFLCDDTISIFEKLPPNSGRFCGKYLERSKVGKPDLKVNGETDFYSIDDFYIGEFVIYLRFRKKGKLCTNVCLIV